MNELALFAGAGGGILGGKLLGWRTVCGVEWDPYAASVLIARQNEGILAPFPIWDDVRTFDGRSWRGRVDVVSGGFPCTDISIAGKGGGIDGAESGMWREQARIIGEVRPTFVLVENSPALTFRGGLRVVGDLAAMGYDCRWGIISAADAIWLDGTPCIDHLRERIWIVATRADADCGRRRSDITGRNDSNGKETGRNESNRELGAVRESISAKSRSDSYSQRELQPQWSEREQRRRTGNCGCTGSGTESIGRGPGIMSGRTGAELSESGNDCQAGCHSDRTRCGEQRSSESGSAEFSTTERAGWWTTEPDVDRMAARVPARVDRIRCIGMSQVPAVVRLAWETLSGQADR